MSPRRVRSLAAPVLLAVLLVASCGQGAGDTPPAVVETAAPDGKILAAGSSGYEPSYEIHLWDPVRGEVRQVLRGHDHDVVALAFSPDGQLLASGDSEGLTRLWDVATGELLQELDQGWRVYGLAFRPDGRQLASAGFDGLIWIWGVPVE